MAKKFLSPLNLVSLTEDPGSASEGDIYWNSSTNKVRVYFDGHWSDISPAAQESDITNLGIKSNNIEGAVSGIENTTTVDTADASIWRTLKYLVQTKYLNEMHSVELIVANDDTNVLVSQYGDVFSQDPLATVTADRNSGIINLKVTPIPGKTPIAVRFFRIGIKV